MKRRYGLLLILSLPVLLAFGGESRTHEKPLDTASKAMDPTYAFPHLDSEAALTKWLGGLGRKRTVRLREGGKEFLVVGHDVGSGQSVMSVYVLEKIAFVDAKAHQGYVVRCLAQKPGCDRIDAKIEGGKRLRVTGHSPFARTQPVDVVTYALE